jgi:hypothetical protein
MRLPVSPRRMSSSVWRKSTKAREYSPNRLCLEAVLGTIYTELKVSETGEQTITDK